MAPADEKEVSGNWELSKLWNRLFKEPHTQGGVPTAQSTHETNAAAEDISVPVYNFIPSNTVANATADSHDLARELNVQVSRHSTVPPLPNSTVPPIELSDTQLDELLRLHKLHSYATEPQQHTSSYSLSMPSNLGDPPTLPSPLHYPSPTPSLTDSGSRCGSRPLSIPGTPETFTLEQPPYTHASTPHSYTLPSSFVASLPLQETDIPATPLVPEDGLTAPYLPRQHHNGQTPSGPFDFTWSPPCAEPAETYNESHPSPAVSEIPLSNSVIPAHLQDYVHSQREHARRGRVGPSSSRSVYRPEVPSLPQSITGPAAELPHASPGPGLIPSYMPMMPSHESIASAQRCTLDTELPFSPHRQWPPVQDPHWPDSMSRVEDPWLSAHGTICHTAEATQAAYSWPSSATPVALPLPQDLPTEAAQTTPASSSASLQSVGGPATFAAAQYASGPVYDIPPPRRRGPRRRAPSAPHPSLLTAPGPSMRRDHVPLAPSPAAYGAHALGASPLPERAPPHAPSHTPRSSQPSTQVAPASTADLPAPRPQQTGQETAAAPAHNAAAGPSTSVVRAAEPEAAGRALPAVRFLDVGYCAYLKAFCERVPCGLNTDVCGLDGCTDVVPQAAIGSHVRDNHPHFTVRGVKHMCPRDHGGRRRGSTGIRGENFIRHLRDEWGTAARCILCKDGGVWLVRPEAAYIERHLKTCRAFPQKGRHALFPAAETDEERTARLVKTRCQLQNGKRRRAAAALEGADADADAAEHQEEHVDGGSEERDKNEDDDSVDSPRRKKQRHSRE